MRINVITSRTGGPYTWGKNLSQMLNERGYSANHTATIGKILLSPLYQNTDLIHSEIPISLRLWNKPFILAPKSNHHIEGVLHRPLWDTAIKTAKHITVPSKYIKELIGADNAVIIPNAIHTNKFSKAKHSDKTEVNILTITSFCYPIKSKGIVELAKQVRSAEKSTDKKLVWTIAGYGRYLNDIENKVRNLGIKSKINFVGKINPADYLPNSDLFAYYSDHDNFPNVFLEAMASGLPIITNNIGATKEILEQNKDGYICSDDYPDKLAMLVNDFKLRAQLGENACRNVEAKFDWNLVIQQYIKFYKEVLECWQK